MQCNAMQSNAMQCNAMQSELKQNYKSFKSPIFSETGHSMPFGLSSIFKSKHEKEREKIKADAQKRVVEANERARYV